jgi:hypothetical protein
MNGMGGVTRLAPSVVERSSDRAAKPNMDQPTPQRGGTSPVSWPRVVWNTLALKLQRSRLRDRQNGILGRRDRALLITGVIVLVAMGGAAAYSLDPLASEGLKENSAPPLVGRGNSGADVREDGAQTPAQRRASTPRAASPGSAHAAAGAEIAARTDITVSDAAASVLRSGAVDGRVLLALAALASTNHLVMIDVSPDDGVTTPTEVELGVTDVDAVLAWLDTQPKLRPDHVEIRRDTPHSFLRLIYQSPEPAGLFPS